MTTNTLDKPIKSAGYFTDGVGTVDPAVAAAMKHELERERYQIELIASENIVSKAVLEAQGSVFTNKYAEGYPGRRYYQGCAPSDEVETLAIDRAKQLRRHPGGHCVAPDRPVSVLHRGQRCTHRQQ